jgi:ATP-binding cassette, subfamily C, bacterial LapB
MEIKFSAMRDLHLCLMRVARLQGDSYNPLELQEVVERYSNNFSEFSNLPKAMVDSILHSMSLPNSTPLGQPDPARVPALVWDVVSGWGVLRGQNALGQWLLEYFNEDAQDWKEDFLDTLDLVFIALVSLTKPFSLQGSNVFQLIKQEILSHRELLIEAAIGGVIINLIALASSLYSMQVYDRVMPTGAVQTLLALTLGAVIATAIELAAKIARSKLYERMIDATDAKLSRAVFSRFLSIRLDQLPRGVGTIAGQLRGYEMVRSFLTSITTQVLVDLPFALCFLFIITLIAGSLVFIPLTFLILSIGFGMLFRKRTEYHTSRATEAANLKTGLLVESIEGAETIKSGHAGWRILSKWIKINDEARGQEIKIRHVSEHSQYVIAAIQQLAYITIIAIGVLEIGKGSLTMGALVAVSILSGRVLGPASTIPSQLVQWGHVKAALKGLDAIWSLKDDHHDIAHPVQLENIRGHYLIENVQAQYMLSPALSITKMEIQGGERIGVIGAIGAGKTTFLRLLSGMYKPKLGRVLLDDVDLSHLSKAVLAEQIGYLQQDGRLFAGTLRENLVLGMKDPGDEAILRVCAELALTQSVIASHPLGLNLEITEGGIGLSGGQKQLVNLTRVFLRQPQIWLLDEPTASMDRALENHVLQALKNRLSPKDTLVLVTHKPELLELVDRLIVIAGHQVVLDGPKALVISQIQAHEQSLKKV